MIDRFRRWAWLFGAALVGMAVFEQLKRSPDERTWHGRLFGAIPYDFRPPTLQRFQEAWWNPASHQLLSARAFGVGWALNLHEVWRWLRGVVTRAGQA